MKISIQRGNEGWYSFVSDDKHIIFRSPKEYAKLSEALLRVESLLSGLGANTVEITIYHDGQHKEEVALVYPYEISTIGGELIESPGWVEFTRDGINFESGNRYANKNRGVHDPLLVRLGKKRVPNYKRPTIAIG